jgi:hypothetical protein
MKQKYMTYSTKYKALTHAPSSETQLNNRERKIPRDVGSNGRGLFKVLSQHFSSGYEENQEIKKPVSEPITCRMKVYHVAILLNR